MSEACHIRQDERYEACNDAMARPREYTPEKLERAVNKYFQSITRRVVRKEMVPTGERDSKGHMIYEVSDAPKKPLALSKQIV